MPDAVPEFISKITTINSGALLTGADRDGGHAGNVICHAVWFWAPDQGDVTCGQQHLIDPGLAAGDGDDRQCGVIVDADAPGSTHVHRQGESTHSARAVQEMRQGIHAHECRR